MVCALYMPHARTHAMPTVDCERCIEHIYIVHEYMTIVAYIISSCLERIQNATHKKQQGGRMQTVRT